MATSLPSTMDNRILEEVFRKEHKKVVKCVSVPAVWESLFANGIITSDDNSALNALNAAKPHVAGKYLMDILHNRGGPTAFVELRHAILDSDEIKWLIVDRIDPEYHRKVEALNRSSHSEVSVVVEYFDATSRSDHHQDDSLCYENGSPQTEPRMKQQVDRDSLDLSQLRPLIEQIINEKIQSKTSDQRRQSSSEGSNTNGQDENVYESLEGALKRTVSLETAKLKTKIETQQRQLDDMALKWKDTQYSFAMQRKGAKMTNFTETDGSPIRAVTCLNETLLLIREKEKEIEFYEMETGQRKHSKCVADLQDPRDMAACGHHSMIFVLDETVNEDRKNSSTIHWVSNDDDGNSGRWPVGEYSKSISVTSRNQLLLTCPGPSPKIQVRTHDGRLINEIRLSKSFDKLHHAVELCTGRIVASCGDYDSPDSKVFIVDASSEDVLNEYALKNKRDKYFYPLRLAVFGDVFVADYVDHRGRVLRLSPDLDKTIRKVTVTGSCMPHRICIDEMGLNVYIVHNEYDRNKKEFSSGCVKVVPLTKAKLVPKRPLPDTANIYTTLFRQESDREYRSLTESKNTITVQFQ